MSSNMNSNPTVNTAIGSGSTSASSSSGHQHHHHQASHLHQHIGGHSQGPVLNKENKSLNDRFKAFFKGFGKATTGSGVSGGAGGNLWCSCSC